RRQAPPPVGDPPGCRALTLPLQKQFFHPERSKVMSEANRLAQSKDPAPAGITNDPARSFHSLSESATAVVNSLDVLPTPLRPPRFRAPRNSPRPLPHRPQ